MSWAGALIRLSLVLTGGETAFHLYKLTAEDGE